ncbi:DUF255 domain-containing protein [Kitasatospora sp. NPDC005748]|uniref:DUF255 domain-containing protein n=1 Tax=Kitasatospora sp. NPDC005748 TaxID=3157063 RepID=UPI00340CE1BC
MVNRLVHAQSPCLQQHAINPVDWWEWGRGGDVRSSKAGRTHPLSVGYASCHWLVSDVSSTSASELTQPGSPPLGCCQKVAAWTHTMSSWTQASTLGWRPSWPPHQSGGPRGMPPSASASRAADSQTSLRSRGTEP